MAINLNYFVVGEYGGVNPQTGKIEIGGIFDVVSSPIFPLTIPNMVGVISFNEVNTDTLFELRINDPEDAILAKIDLGVRGQMQGLPSKQVIAIENIPVVKRGKYTVDILEKNGAGYKFVKSSDLFTAMYPPKRRFTEEEIRNILENKDEVIVSVKTDYTIPGTEEVKKFQLNLDETMAIEEGYEVFPYDNKIEVSGVVYDLEGIRRNVEWMFGQAKPKQQAEIDEKVEG